MNDQKKMITTPCPHCKKSLQWSSDNPYRPFCCKRCQMIDLGAWANESYAIAKPLSSEEEIE